MLSFNLWEPSNMKIGFFINALDSVIFPLLGESAGAENAA